MLKVREACCLGVPESNRSLRSAAGFLVGSSTISVTEKPEQDFPAGKCFSPPPSSLCLHLPGYPHLCFCTFLTTQYLWAFPTLTAMGTHNLGGCFRQSVLTSPASPDCAGSLKHLTGCSQPPGFFTSSPSVIQCEDAHQAGVHGGSRRCGFSDALQLRGSKPTSGRQP